MTPRLTSTSAGQRKRYRLPAARLLVFAALAAGGSGGCGPDHRELRAFLDLPPRGPLDNYVLETTLARRFPIGTPAREVVAAVQATRPAPSTEYVPRRPWEATVTDGGVELKSKAPTRLDRAFFTIWYRLSIFFEDDRVAGYRVQREEVGS